MTDTPLLRHQDAGVLTLSFNRPHKLNAIDNTMAQALLDALEGAAANASVRVIRLRGNGRAFCAGRDVNAAPTDRDLELVQAVAQAIVQQPQPVVAAVHGWTVGAGVEWMLNADIVYASEDTRFRLPEATLGVFVTGGLVATLPAAIGLARAKALMLLGEMWDAQQAAHWGMVHQVVPALALDAASQQACERLAALNPLVAGEFKRVLNRVGLAQFDAAIAEECRAQRLLGGAAPAPSA